ncbi:unnamed protein product [Prunus armeniaca]
MVFILPEKFRAAEGQENTLEGDVFSQESFECRLTEVEEAPEQQTGTQKIGGTTTKLAAEQLFFSKPTREMTNHLRPLFITANFGGIPISKVLVDGGASINLLPHRLLTKMGRTEDWIHQSLCVPSTLHQQLALWNEEGHMEILETDPRPFLPSAMFFEARYYHDDLGPFTFLGVNQNGSPHGVTAQRLIEDGLASSLEDWNIPFVLNLQNSDV